MTSILESDPGIATGDAGPKRRKQRCTIDLSSRVEDKLDAISEAYGETKSEIVRRALEHFLKCREYKQKGYDTGAFKELEDGSVRLVSIDSGVD